jgi:hypothetical protein
MKNLIASLALAVAVPAAAVPDVVTYAARVENDAGAFDGTVSATFSLFSAATSGNALWSETATSIVVVDGDLVHDLGSIEPLDDAVLDSDALFLEVTLNGDTLSPRAALRAVPFALKAREAETLAGLSADDVATDAEVAAAVAARVVAFNQLSGVPAGFADGVDNDTVATAAAGGGLAVAGNAFSVADNGITLAKMADSSIGSAEIVDGSITSNDIGNNAVGSSEIADGSITANDIASNAVGGAEIAANAVTADEIAGTEVALYRRVNSCTNPGAISVLATCEKQTCAVGVGIGRVRCDNGTCEAGGSTTCANEVIGFLLAP